MNTQHTSTSIKFHNLIYIFSMSLHGGLIVPLILYNMGESDGTGTTLLFGGDGNNNGDSFSAVTASFSILLETTLSEW